MTFLIYAVFAMIGLVIVIRLVPETKGKKPRGTSGRISEALTRLFAAAAAVPIASHIGDERRLKQEQHDAQHANLAPG